MHSECGLTFSDVAEYTPQELARLQLGWAIREQGASAGDASTPHRRGHRKKRQEMLSDLGFE